MNLAKLSIQRPVFIACTVILIVVVGLVSFSKLGVENFPDMSIPMISVNATYPGAAPSEIETLVAKPIEDELSTISGLKKVRSICNEGSVVIVAEFTSDTVIREAEQQVRDKVSFAKKKLPAEVEEPIIKRLDPADQPILSISLQSELEDNEFYDFASETIKQRLISVSNVGSVDIVGGRKKEIWVELDRNKLKSRNISASQVSQKVAAGGANIPAGKVRGENSDLSFRTINEYRSFDEIRNVPINFLNNEIPIQLSDVGRVVVGSEDVTSLAYWNGKPALFLLVYKQSGSNSVEVAESVKKRIDVLKKEFPNVKFDYYNDSSKVVKDNVWDVEESIYIGIALTVIVVLFFLGSVRSTLITGLALPTSLLGSFILMGLAGFTINQMTLLALSLAVGLLIDDAIVVRENIHRHKEMGKDSKQAALEGTKEVTLAVLATTFAILAVFGPIAFIDGVIGQILRPFGLTVCFALLISLYDALTIAPMMSAYFGGEHHPKEPGKIEKFLSVPLHAFDKFQEKLTNVYVKSLEISTKHPLFVVSVAVFIFVSSIFVSKTLKSEFIPTQDLGQFTVTFELPPGSSVEATKRLNEEVNQLIRSKKEVQLTAGYIKQNKIDIYVELVPAKQRKVNTPQFKEYIRKELSPYVYAKPIVKNFDAIGGGQRSFSFVITGNEAEELETYSKLVFEKIKKIPDLTDPDISLREGAPEFKILPKGDQIVKLGVNPQALGRELRTNVEGDTPAVFREKSFEYDIRVRMLEDQRNIQKNFHEVFVPNINGYMVPLSYVSSGISTTGPATIQRQNRNRSVEISADTDPNGRGSGYVMSELQRILKEDLPLPDGIKISYSGQTENLESTGKNMAIALGLGVVFIYLVLASLYESFIIPISILVVIPLAMTGAFYGLFLTGKSMDIFANIGMILLFGLATKNSILLIDFAKDLQNTGVDTRTALIEAGRARLRPILMTSIALIAGMLPVAIGLNEASKQRTSMGITVIGGLISSTILTLYVIPAVYQYITRLIESFSKKKK
ncbi:efflux RND transporter permease subunit [Leptospira brenneri]|uniref:Efflux RND transporter permease subunit n=1 Tax=Leptospira brenneri TaxID=2023182 RepID=A0A2M9XZ11_9LEPT|nr:efflux RND transporter permease subunit [Leptospira brenneri]PJZ44555.1 multidrug transporter [Leptospira brenneri]TGK95560.1 efflux RND transporter permease subunit [Leptospira brenneri]